MLLNLSKQTGLVYMAVCAGGSALSSPSGGGLRYSQLLAELPSGLEIITPVICVNDCYKKGKIVAFDNAWLVDVAELCELAAKKASRCFAVVGGSAATWKYEDRLSVEQCLLFNANVQRLREGFAAKNVESISGAIELQGIQLGDPIGHVSDASEDIVFDAFVAWSIRGHETASDVAPVVADRGLVLLPIISETSPLRSPCTLRVFPIEGCVSGGLCRLLRTRSSRKTHRVHMVLCQWNGGNLLPVRLS